MMDRNKNGLQENVTPLVHRIGSVDKSYKFQQHFKNTIRLWFQQRIINYDTQYVLIEPSMSRLYQNCV